MGLGYIGLPTASLLATKGHKVHGVDVRSDVIETINRGDIHIVEPELDVLVRSAVLSGNLRASLEPAESDIFVLAVPTPFREGHQPDLSYVDSATEAIAPYVREGDLIILESTSPVGTTERVAERLEAARPDLCPSGQRKFFVAHCPERVLPGHILRELVDNDRMVGGVDVGSAEKAAAFYNTFVSGEVLVTDARTAELAKLTENSFRDVNIAFANELSVVCHRLGVDVWELISLANRHPRVSILSPGPGVGGHCIAVDPWFIVSSAPEEAKLIRAAREINVAKESWVVARVIERAERFRKPVIACLGLAYKPDIDDLRESPALEVTRALMATLPDGEILAVEPNLHELEGFAITNLDDALQRADIVVGLVAHAPFKRIDRSRLQEKVVIDTCGLFR
ncbi:MAG: UDP-N-acetyl-D-mannosamine dehydrogenase [Proteobacteria bacterium]|nr:UDP-N-acetyl-D-mannosamine dehydrogenase [Pseudomonadota bacterium]